MDENAVRELLDRLLAPWVRSLGLVPVSIGDDSVTLRLPFSGEFRHSGGIICGHELLQLAVGRGLGLLDGDTDPGFLVDQIADGRRRVGGQ